MNSGLLKALAEGGGWDSLREAAEQPGAEEIYKSQLEAYELAQDFDAMLSSAAGQRVLDWLIENTLFQPSFYIGSVNLGGDIAALPADQQGFIREGQNSLVRFMLEQQAAAKLPPPEAPGQNTAQEGRDDE